MAPPAKRARGSGGSGSGSGSGSSGSSRASSVADREKLVKRLSKESAHALLMELMATSTKAHTAVESEVALIDTEPVNLGAYSNRASDILCSLYSLRASQQFMRCGEVSQKLTELLDDCKERLSSTNAFKAMVSVMSTIHSEAEGEVRKGLLGCGGIDGHVAEELECLAEDMSAGEKASVSDAVVELEAVANALEDYGCGYDLAKVVNQIRGN
ncbi:unnamed protein product [Pylaiella littoralis]